MENYVQVHTEPGYKKSEKRVFLNSMEEGKYYYFEMEKVKDIFLGKLIEKTASASGRNIDLLIAHTYNRDRVKTQTSFGIEFVYKMWEAENINENS